MSEQNEENQFKTIWGISEKELEEIRSRALEQAKNTRHTWRQKGFWLVCKTCDMPHAMYTEKVMIGEKTDGTPILINREKA